VGSLLLALLLSQDPAARLLDALREGELPAASAAVDALVAAGPVRAVRGLAPALPRLRERLAQLLDLHAAARAKVIDYDVDFPLGLDRGPDRQRLEAEAREKVRQSFVRALEGERLYDKVLAALRGARGAEAALAAEAARPGSWILKCELYEALAALEARQELLAAMNREKDPAVLATVLQGVRSDYATAFLEHPHWQVRLAALGALRDEPVAAERLVGAVASPDARFRSEAVSALSRLTGVVLPADGAVWRDWWDANAEAFRAGRFRRGEWRPPSGPGRTTFYGIPVRSTRIAFVIDKSGSMRDAGRFETAKAEMRALLAALPDGALVNAVFFAGRPNAWVKGTRPLDEQARRDLERWVDDQDFAAYTDLYRALEAALALVGSAETGRLREDGPDTIVVLSDGQATAGRLQDDELIARVVARRARYLRPVIHTVSVASDAKSLRRLAELTGGEATAK
jgi:hypothetical protein